VLVEQLGTAKHYIVKDWPAREDYSWKKCSIGEPQMDASPSTTCKAGAYEELCESLGQQW